MSSTTASSNKRPVSERKKKAPEALKVASKKSNKSNKPKSAKSATASTKKRKRPASGLSGKQPYKNMIAEAIICLKHRQGSSRMAIKKFITANHEDHLNMDFFDTSMSRALRLGCADGTFEQVKQSFRLSRNSRPKMKGIVDGTTSKPRKASRPLKKWTVEVLNGHDNMKFDDIRDDIAKEHKISGEYDLFERALKAVLTRGAKDDVFACQGDNDAATYSLSATEKENQAEKEKKKAEKAAKAQEKKDKSAEAKKKKSSRKSNEKKKSKEAEADVEASAQSA